MSGAEISLFERRETAMTMELRVRELEYLTFLAEWGASVRQTRAGDRAVVSYAVEDLCRAYGVGYPEIIWCRGPQHALRRIRELKRETKYCAKWPGATAAGGRTGS